MRYHTFLPFAFLLFTLSTSAQIGQEGASVSPKEVPQNAKLLELASKLAAYGRQTKSAMSLIQAAQIFQRLNVVDAADSTGQTNPLSDSQLLADATKYADGNKKLLALIKETGQSTRGGAIDPPIRYFRVVDPGETVYQDLYADGSQYIQVIVDGQSEGVFNHDKKTDDTHRAILNLTVFDKEGRVIASDKSGGENCAAAFISRTTYMTIAVSNKGQLADSFVLYVYKTPMNY